MQGIHRQVFLEVPDAIFKKLVHIETSRFVRWHATVLSGMDPKPRIPLRKAAAGKQRYYPCMRSSNIRIWT